MDPKQACLANCELFGRFADYFESQVVPLWGAVYEELVSRANITPRQRLLDVGTGTGEVALRASGRVGKRGAVVGVDAEAEMLKIARRKTKKLSLHNVEFKQMSAETLDFPEASFDSVVGNYSLCCCFDYEAALAQCLRVLKPGGRLTYNHSGPADPLEFQVASRIFEKYQADTPSHRLRQIREANLAQNEAVKKYRDPFVTLSTMRSLGYEGAEAAITQRVIRYPDAGAFVERMLGFNWRNEADEISADGLRKFRSEAAESLASLWAGRGFQVADEMVFFSGRKP